MAYKSLVGWCDPACICACNLGFGTVDQRSERNSTQSDQDEKRQKGNCLIMVAIALAMDSTLRIEFIPNA